MKIEDQLSQLQSKVDDIALVIEKLTKPQLVEAIEIDLERTSTIVGWYNFDTQQSDFLDFMHQKVITYNVHVGKIKPKTKCIIEVIGDVQVILDGCNSKSSFIDSEEFKSMTFVGEKPKARVTLKIYKKPLLY